MDSATSYLHECDREKLEKILRLAAASRNQNLLDAKEEFDDDLILHYVGAAHDQEILHKSKAMRDEDDNARRLADAKGRLAWCNDAINTAQAQRKELGQATESSCSALQEKMFDLHKQRSGMELLADAAQVNLQRSTADEIDAAQQRKVIEARCDALTTLILEVLDEAKVWRSESKSIWVQRLRDLVHHSADIKAEETRNTGWQPKMDKRSRVEIAEQYEEQASFMHKEIQRLRQENLCLTAEAKQRSRSSRQPGGALEVARRRLLDCARKVKWLEDSCAETRSQLMEQDKFRSKLEEKLSSLQRKLSEAEAAAAAHLGTTEKKLTPQELDIQAAARCLQARANEEVIARGTANTLPLSSASYVKPAPTLPDKSSHWKAALTTDKSSPGKPVAHSAGSHRQVGKAVDKGVAGEATQTTLSTVDSLVATATEKAAEKGVVGEMAQTTLSTVDSLGDNDTANSASVPVFFNISPDILEPESKILCRQANDTQLSVKDSNGNGEQCFDGQTLGGLFDMSSIEALAKQPLNTELCKDDERVLAKPYLSAPFDIASIEALTAEIGASLGF